MNSFWKDWTLLTHKGRQIWRFTKQDTVTNAYLQDAAKAFDFNKHINPNAADLVYRNAKLEGQDIGERKSDSVEDALQQAMHFYSSIQTEDGNWTGDYGGPLFLLPGLVVASVVTNTPLPAVHQRLMAQYIFNQQNKDGGWGLHIEDKSTVFGTVMNYVALRFLGFDLSDERMLLAQTWIQQTGGATGIPSWGKFYLSLLNVYAWEGNNTLLPELWLLPKGLPIHPWRYWCHTRMVYLPMSYCYAHRIQIAESELVHAIRKEIYTTPYNQINWTKAKDEVNALDVYHKASSILNVFNAFANFYERSPIQRWRKKALDFVSTYIDAEDEQTNYINIGPVNQVVNSIAVWHKYGKESEQFQKTC
jgi:squalene/oxidosqualene cyclase-like protein